MSIFTRPISACFYPPYPFVFYIQPKYQNLSKITKQKLGYKHLDNETTKIESISHSNTQTQTYDRITLQISEPKYIETVIFTTETSKLSFSQNIAVASLAPPQNNNFTFNNQITYQRAYQTQTRTQQNAVVRNNPRVSSNEIYNILCSTVRGAYVSYDRASTAARSIDNKYNGTYRVAYDQICSTIRGAYCSYDKAQYCANCIAQQLNN